MNIYMRFPAGKAKALTLSYDDGVAQDIRLIEILNRQGIKATFNINTGCFGQVNTYDKGRMTERQAIELYSHSGHEVAIHGYSHPFLEQLPLAVAIDDVLTDRKNLGSLFGTVIRGMAYPYGTYNDALVTGLEQIGIAYARTTKSTHNFSIPTDWLRLSTTCHHNDSRLDELTECFVEKQPNHAPWLFYLWGHSFEFDKHDNWHVIENFAKKTGKKDDIWYATNIEIYDYIEAYRRLQFSVECKVVYNPSAMPVWFEKDGKMVMVQAGRKAQI